MDMTVSTAAWLFGKGGTSYFLRRQQQFYIPLRGYFHASRLQLFSTEEGAFLFQELLADDNAGTDSL